MAFYKSTFLYMPNKPGARAGIQKAANKGAKVLLPLVKALKTSLINLSLPIGAKLQQIYNLAIWLAGLVLKVFVKILFF